MSYATGGGAGGGGGVLASSGPQGKAMPPGVEMNGAFYYQELGPIPVAYRGRPPKESKSSPAGANKKKGKSKSKPKEVKPRKNARSPAEENATATNGGRIHPAINVWYANEKGRTCAFIGATSILVDSERWKDLRNVQELYIEDEEESLRCLPSDVSTLRHLRTLSVRWSRMKALSQNLDDLPLTHACLAQNRLQVLNGIEHLSNLTVLDVSCNHLPQLPDNIDVVRSLRELHANGNKLKSLPDQIGNLQFLQELHVSSNRLTSLPDDLCRCTQLTVLDVSMNSLTALPERIGKLTNLVQLVVSCNKINALPVSLQNATELKHLLARLNNLKEVPDFLHYASSLETLNVQSNNISSVNCTIRSLRILLLDDNNLDELNAEIFGCTSLQNMGLQQNKLRAIPPEIRQLTSLRILNLGHNQLTSLPPEIGGLRNLRHLYLHNNKLTGLPREFQYLDRVTTLNLEQNELEPMWASSSRQGVEACRRMARTGNPLGKVTPSGLDEQPRLPGPPPGRANAPPAAMYSSFTVDRLWEGQKGETGENSRPSTIDRLDRSRAANNLRREATERSSLTRGRENGPRPPANDVGRKPSLRRDGQNDVERKPSLRREGPLRSSGRLARTDIPMTDKYRGGSNAITGSTVITVT